MRRRTVLRVGVISAGIFAGTLGAESASAACPYANTELPTSNPTALQVQHAHAAVFCLTNQERRRHHLYAYTTDPRLDRAAQARTDDMNARRYFDHTTPDGKRADHEQLRNARYPIVAGGENIAIGYSTPLDAVRIGWMGDFGHCQGVLDPRLRQVGVGLTLGPPLDNGDSRGLVPFWDFISARRSGQRSGHGARAPAAGCPYYDSHGQSLSRSESARIRRQELGGG